MRNNILNNFIGGRTISLSKNVGSMRTNSLCKNVVSMRTNSWSKNVGGMRTISLSKNVVSMRTSSLNKNCRRKVGNSVVTTTPLNFCLPVSVSVRARGRCEAVYYI